MKTTLNKHIPVAEDMLMMTPPFPPESVPINSSPNMHPFITPP